MPFEPSAEILKKYADVLIKFALWNGKGAQKGETVSLTVPECAKPILKHLQKAVLECGAHPIITYLPEGISRNFYEMANDEQLHFFPRQYMLEKVKACTHFVTIIATDDKFELKGVDSAKIMSRSKASKFSKDAFMNKMDSGRGSWTLGLYGTEAMAKDVDMSLQTYWKEITKACFLDYATPIEKWRQINAKIEQCIKKLNAMEIQWVHITGKDTDLKIKIGDHREWLGGRGCNIPSFEIFTSPDFHGTEGWIRFSEPLYRYGDLIKGIELRFKNGKIIESTATENQKLLKDMISVKNADMIGEFSMTDSRFSRITKFMGETLFDENVGGKFGNIHIAVGSSYRETYPDKEKLMKLKSKDWDKLGYNNSAIHTDIVSTTKRTVTATLKNGKEKVIYENGRFTFL
jgi:aminopeptidase